MPAQVSHNGREGRFSLLSVSENDDRFHPEPLSFVKQITKCLEQRGLLLQNVRKQNPRALLAARQDQRFAGRLMSPSTVKFLTQSETFNQVLEKAAPWSVSIVEPGPRERKKTFHVLTSFCFTLFFCLCLCLFYFSLYCRIHFFLTLNTL